MIKTKTIPIIDLFAGPGGLGEGFSSLTNKYGKPVFKIALSIEKDHFAHQTLELRSFIRQFKPGKIPAEYYKFLRSEITRKELFLKFPVQSQNARKEAWNAELGVTPPDEIDKRISRAVNKGKWVLIGGPPCQAYSVIGRARQRQKNGLDENDPRVFLYREYYRILAVHNPPVFIMENVKGLLSSKVRDKFIFNEILNDLENPAESYRKLKGKRKTQSDCPGYYLFSLVKKPGQTDFYGRPEFDADDFIIKAENYGIPQKRHRVIIMGLRKDFFSKEPDTLIPGAREISIDSVINKLPRLRSGLSKIPDSKENWLKVLKNFIYDNDLPVKTDYEIRNHIAKITGNLRAPSKNRGSEFIASDSKIDYKSDWFIDKNIHGILNHSTRSHLSEDLHRYLFASCYAAVKKRSPKLADFPYRMLPKHKSATEGKFEDRFRVQIYGESARTITSHIAKDGHYYIHPDPSQCRSLTVREAARIQTFPDNYFFCGPRTSQYIQVGNAVPPLLAHQIAEIVFKILN